ncbi:MAG TPA: beta-glucosidase BglX [Gemmatimonadaceae bacterium]|nr:beta-glucosidase BglX [Gemmatimonadaceae bacterium]
MGIGTGVKSGRAETRRSTPPSATICQSMELSPRVVLAARPRAVQFTAMRPPFPRPPRRISTACLALVVLLSAEVADAQAGATRAPAHPTDTAITSRRAARIADSVLALMTLDEKLGQITQAPAGYGQTGPTVDAGGEQAVREGKIGSFLSLYGAGVTRKMQRIAVEESRLRIPLVFGYDVIHGMRTIFPVPLAEAASFDSAAAARSARIAAVEGSAMGVHWTFAPMVDIARDARWGRIVEGAGEDPYLGSVMAAARVRGFQGDALRAPTSLLATAKHFAAYGAAEAGRDYNVAAIGERTMWEVYLPPFEAAVRAGAGSLMASFNEIDGTPAHASRWLLTDVLRDRWKFDGLVVSDWTGVWELLQHFDSRDSTAVAKRALRAGVDMEMSSALYRTKLAAEVRAGRFPIAVIDEAVRRTLRVKAALGLFEDPYRGTSVERETRELLAPAHRQAAREIARESIVLLTNRSVGGAPALPLRKDMRSLAVIGPLADDAKSTLGSWSGAGKPEDAVSVLAGLRTALPNARIVHVRGAPVDTLTTAGFADAERAARDAEAVLLVLGERGDMSGEASSRASIELPGSQLALAQAVVRAAGAAKPVVAVLMNGRPLAVPWLADSTAALVESWFLGVEHGNALADVLFGDVAPSGKLPVTIPRATGQVPIYYAHKNTGRPADPNQHYTSKYLDLPWTPLFAFGHGLSYTTFTYSDLKPATGSIRAGDRVNVAVTVRNTGSRDGTEVVQLYLRQESPSVTRPVRELRGFQRVTLKAGESRTVTFTLQPDAFALFDAEMRRVIEPGTYRLWAGGSSEATLGASVAVTGPTRVLAPAPPRMR